MARKKRVSAPDKLRRDSAQADVLRRAAQLFADETEQIVKCPPGVGKLFTAAALTLIGQNGRRVEIEDAEGRTIQVTPEAMQLAAFGLFAESMSTLAQDVLAKMPSGKARRKKRKKTR